MPSEWRSIHRIGLKDSRTHQTGQASQIYIPGTHWPTSVLRAFPRSMSASHPIRDGRYMTARQRTICYLVNILLSVVLSDYLLQDSAIGMTASEMRIQPVDATSWLNRSAGV
jgi:hypothetical protein